MRHEEIERLAEAVKLCPANPNLVFYETRLAEACLQLLSEGEELAEALQAIVTGVSHMTDWCIKHGVAKGIRNLGSSTVLMRHVAEAAHAKWEAQ